MTDLTTNFASNIKQISADYRSSNLRCFVRKGVLRNFAKFTGKHLCQSLFFKKETLAQVLSCEFCEIFKSTFFTEHLWWLLLENLSNKCHGHLNFFFFISIHNKFVCVKNIIQFYVNLPKIYLPTNKYVSKYGYYKIK